MIYNSFTMLKNVKFAIFVILWTFLTNLSKMTNFKDNVQMKADYLKSFFFFNLFVYIYFKFYF